MTLYNLGLAVNLICELGIQIIILILYNNKISQISLFLDTNIKIIFYITILY